MHERPSMLRSTYIDCLFPAVVQFIRNANYRFRTPVFEECCANWSCCFSLFRGQRVLNISDLKFREWLKKMEYGVKVE